MSRIDASAASMETNASDSVIISITDYGDRKNTFNQATWIKGILEIQFDDVEVGSPNCITKEQAIEIAEFVLRIKWSVKRVIVHCEFGQSRSAGVAAAISVFLEGHDNGIFFNRRYYPNRTCYRYVLNALRKKGQEPKYLIRKWLLRR